jgi:predicted DNA-binding transcriptional regulator AlpA
MKTQQSSKIMELRDALLAAGIVSLDEQAQVLGLSRSTTWTILRAKHKNSGLSAAIISRMLKSPQLPPPVRDKIFQYIDGKATGLYGHTKLQRQRFAARLSDWRMRNLGGDLTKKHYQPKKQLSITR